MDIKPGGGDGTVILLGAGASREAGLPLAIELTAKLKSSLKANPKPGWDFHRVYELSEQFLSPRLSALPTPRAVTYEDILSFIKFISGDPYYDPAATLINRSDPAIKAIYDAIKPGETNPSSQRIALNWMVYSIGLEYLPELLQIPNDENAAYLQPLLVAPDKPHYQVIASLNYDEAIEKAAGLANVMLSTLAEDIVNLNKSPALRPGMNYLMKLHGSMTWRPAKDPDGDGSGKTKYSLREAPYVPGESRDDLSLLDPLMICNPRAKVTLDSPYVDLFVLFKRELNHARRLITIGYSFNDVHINRIISGWIAEQKELIIVNGESPGMMYQVEDWKIFRSELVIRIVRENASKGIAELMKRLSG